MLTTLSLLKSSGRPVPVCCQWARKIDRSKMLTWPSPLRSPWRLLTTTVTAVDVVLLLEVSVALAVSVWLELLVNEVVFQLKVYGAVISVPTKLPST